MVRLSSLLPIIKLAPILDRDPGRPPNAPLATAKPGAPQDGSESPGKTNAPDPAAQKQPVLTRDALPVRSRDGSAQAPAEHPDTPLPNRPAPADPRIATAPAAPRQAATPAQSPLAGAARPTGSVLATPPSPASQPRFSATATVLASLTPKASQVAVPGQIHGLVPLLPGAPERPAVLAAALRDAISQSGLFYESHLEQWSNGSLPLEALKQEPQAALPPLLDFSPSQSNAPAPGQPQATIASDPMAWLQQNLVQQLGVLNHPALAWSGEVWPGQSLAVQTGREPAKSIAGEAPWVTRLSLEMPRLGKVDVLISLDSRGVELDVRGEAADALTMMQASQADLGRQLADTGCTLRRMQIRSGGESA